MSEVPDGTVDEVLAWVGDDVDRAKAALEAESAGKERTTLISQLEEIVAPTDESAPDPEPKSAPSGGFVALRRIHTRSGVFEVGDVIDEDLLTGGADRWIAGGVVERR